ncbi:MAG: hypothetical protein IPH44_20140 [Myxococcales bacterium]|nr:hypothetical protein [Myxococcales bacterium]
MGRRRITTEDAGGEYERRHPGRAWGPDAGQGVFLAVLGEVRTIVASRGAALERAVTGKAPLVVEVPAWFSRWFTYFRDGLRARPELDDPFVRLFSQAFCDDPSLSQPGGARVTLNFDAGVELTIGLLHSLPALRADHDRLRREEYAIHGFYEGVRAAFVRDGRRTPGAGDIALLAAAAGIEPLEPSLDRTRKRWEKRIARWHPPH